MHHLMAKFWWIFALRGLLGILLFLLSIGMLLWNNAPLDDLFGLLVFDKMASVISSIILLLGLYVFADGLFSVTLGAQDYGDGRRWPALILEGVLSMALGIAVWFGSIDAEFSLLFWVAAWAFLTGLLEIKEGFDLNEYKDRRPIFLTAGIVSILFGALVIFMRASGLDLIELIGAYALVFGVLFLLFAFRLRHYATTIKVD